MVLDGIGETLAFFLTRVLFEAYDLYHDFVGITQPDQESQEEDYHLDRQKEKCTVPGDASADLANNGAIGLRRSVEVERGRGRKHLITCDNPKKGRPIPTFGSCTQTGTRCTERTLQGCG